MKKKRAQIANVTTASVRHADVTVSADSVNYFEWIWVHIMYLEAFNDI